MLYDQIALENHDYIATKAERIHNSKHWVLSMNAEGPQLPRQERPDHAAAKRECQRLQDEFLAETLQFSTNQFIRANKCTKIRISNSKEVMTMITLLIGKQDGNGTKTSRETCRMLRLRRPHHGRIPYGKFGIHGGGMLQSLMKGSE